MPRFVLAQINSTVGDLAGNGKKVLDALQQAEKWSPDLVIFPELTLAGYPPEDLLLKPRFVDACADIFASILPKIQVTCLVGLPVCDAAGDIYNAAHLIRNGVVEATYYKNLLPNYSVFDEERYFKPGDGGLVFDIAGTTVGSIICEDAWEDNTPATVEAKEGATIIACLSASPFYRDKHSVREKTFARLCKNNNVWFLYCNLIGGQDDLVFDGASLVLNPAGEIVARGKEFAEDMMVFDLNGDTFTAVDNCNREKLSTDAEVYDALTLGVRDYVHKNGFEGVIIGLSGGIDSALTAAIAVDALGPEHVLGVTMPSRYSSGETKSDAEILARNLGIRFETLPIGEPYSAFRGKLDPLFAGVDTDPENLTDQNLQARIRAVYLMALSNKLGMLVLNTSNKSEGAVGYGTLYGDMIGGYAAIKDVFKTHVWELSRFVNIRHGREVIPVSTIERVPSAELKPDQEDRDSIPDYPVLDPILELFVEQDLVASEIVQAGHDLKTVNRVVELVDRNEFKRRQSVMGVRVTPKAFGKDRRLPVTNRFRTA